MIFINYLKLEGTAGHLLNVASLAGWIPIPNQNVYSASKSFVLSFSLALSDELKASKKSGIKESASVIQETLESLEKDDFSLLKTLDSVDVKKKNLHKLRTDIRMNQGTIQHCQEQVDSLESADAVDSVDTSGSEKELKNDEESIIDLNKKQQSQNHVKTYIEAIFELLKDTGIKTKIIREYLPVMNKLINQYLQVLDFFVSFNLDDSFNETIKSRHRDDFSYDSFSEGEKQRIDLALLFAWRQIAKMKNSANTNLLILDETFD